MKICIVSLGIVQYFRRHGSASYGGAEVQAAFLAEALAAAGHDISLVVADLRPGERLPFRAENAFHKDSGARVIRFFHPRLSGIYRALARTDADVYYQRNAGMATGVTAMFCRRKRRVFVYGAGSDTDFSFRAARLDNFRDRLLFYRGLRLSHGIVVQNKFQKDVCLAKLDKPVKMISNGVNVMDSNSPGPREFALWMGSIRPIKRPEMFLELAVRIPEKRFVLVGGATRAERAFAERIVDRAKAIPNLEVTGHRPHHEAQDYLRRASVLVNTSQVEGFPNAYLEAWNHGAPVVSFNDVDGLLEHEGLGILCRSLDDMEDALRSLVDDDGRLRSIARRAKALVIDRFSGRVLTEEYISFFDDLIAEKGS